MEYDPNFDYDPDKHTYAEMEAACKAEEHYLWEQRLLFIESFAAEQGLAWQAHHTPDGIFSILEDLTAQPFDPAWASGYMHVYHELITHRAIGSNCHTIAERTYHQGITAGTMGTGMGTSRMTGYGNHYINYDHLPDGSVVAFDLTAGKNTDNEQGTFDVLAVRAPDLDTLVARIAALYDGQWQILQPHRQLPNR